MYTCCDFPGSKKVVWTTYKFQSWQTCNFAKSLNGTILCTFWVTVHTQKVTNNDKRKLMLYLNIYFPGNIKKIVCTTHNFLQIYCSIIKMSNLNKWLYLPNKVNIQYVQVSNIKDNSIKRLNSIHSHGKWLYGYMFDKIDTVFSYWRALIICYFSMNLLR